MNSADPENPGDAGGTAHRIVVFTTVALALFMSTLDQTIVATALDSIRTAFDTSLTLTAWTITVYGLGLLAMLPLAGKLADGFGRRRVFRWSVVVFTIGSLGCGLADSISTLLIFRFVQAIGGAGFTPSATGIIVEHFGRARDRAIGLFGVIFPVGATLGPVLGGLLITAGSWRAIFYVNVPIGILILALTWLVVPEDTRRTSTARFSLDWLGLAALLVTVTSVMVAVSLLDDTSSIFRFPIAGGLALVGAGSLTALLIHIRRSADPLIRPQLLYGRGFGAVNALNLTQGGMLAGLVTLIPHYAVDRYSLSVFESGMLLAGQGIAVIVAGATGAILLRRLGYRMPMLGGYGIAVVGFVLLAVPAPSGSGYGWLFWAAAVIGFGKGFADPAARNAALQIVPQHASAVAAVRTMSRQIGIITSVSIASVYIAGADDSATAHAIAFVAGAVVLTVAMVAVRWVPEHRGAW